MLSFRQFEAGPDPFGRKFQVFFKWLREIEAIPHDPALAVLQRSGPAPLAEILSPDDVTRVISHAASLRRGERPDARSRW